MNISLRRASALQNTIQEAIRAIKIEPVIHVSEFVDSERTIIDANQTLLTHDARRSALTLAYYNIRSLVATANVSCGISMKLATAAFIDRRVAQLQEMTSAGPRDLLFVEKKLEKIRATDNNSRLYGREDSVPSSVLTQEQIATLNDELRALKKQKQSLNDEILELNIKTEITFGEQTLRTLTNEGLI